MGNQSVRSAALFPHTVALHNTHAVDLFPHIVCAHSIHSADLFLNTVYAFSKYGYEYLLLSVTLQLNYHSWMRVQNNKSTIDLVIVEGILKAFTLTGSA